jgi:hypothetical protein
VATYITTSQVSEGMNLRTQPPVLPSGDVQ